MVRTIISIVLGLVAAFAIVAGTDALSTALYPAPVEMDTADSAAIAAWMAGVPFPAKLVLVAGWFLGPFAGAWLALRISDRVWAGWVVVALFTAACLANALMLPHPLWMRVAAVALPLVAGWLAARLHRKPYPGEPLLG